MRRTGKAIAMYAMAAALFGALLVGTVLLAGCGTAANAVSSVAPSRPPHADEVRLLVSRDFGDTVLVDEVVPYREKLSVMRLLAENADVETGYGGGFVGSIDGVRSTFGKVGPGNASDWFYWVDGSLADIGADYYTLAGGQTVWWDYHVWAGAAFVPTSLACFPAPFAGSSTDIYTDEPADPLFSWAESVGLRPTAAGDIAAWLGAASGGGLPGNDGVSTLIAVPLSAMEATLGDAVAEGSTANEGSTPGASSALADLLGGGAAKGVFVGLENGTLTALSLTGSLGPALVAAAFSIRDPETQHHFALILLYENEAARDALLAELTPEKLRARVAIGIAADNSGVVHLPFLSSTKAQVD